MCLQSIDGSFIPCADKNGIPVIRNVVLGGSKCIKNETLACNPCSYNASAMMATYLLNN